MYFKRIGETIEKVIVDTRSIVKRVRRKKVGKEKVSFYNEKSSMFNHFGIEREIEKHFKNLCWLPNGAYLIVEQMETMTVIDVNTVSLLENRIYKDTVLHYK